jgi:integrase
MLVMSSQTQEQMSSYAFQTFVNTCRSPITRQQYVKGLHYFMAYLHLPLDAYDRLLDKDVKIIQMNVCDFVVHLRKKGLSSASVSAYVAAVNKFYAMNDITLNWKKIRSFMGEHEKTVEDRPYTHSEIQTLIQHASPRNKAIILLMSSGGLRVGAISILRIKDLEPNDNYGIFKVSVYSKSRKSRYFTFCTPECRKSIEDYLDYRRRWGERMGEESPLFRVDFNPQIDTRNEVKSISYYRCMHIVSKLLKDTGLRKMPTEGKVQRSHLMGNHGFRKFFETNAFKAGMDHMYLRRLMGQKSGLEDAYLKLSEEELLEGDSKHVGYVGIIDQLTIDESNKLRRENQQLLIKTEKIDLALSRINDLEKQLGLT